MIEVGVLGLDTSHPEQFASILDDFEGATVTAAWDSGDVRDDGYAETFCAEHGAALYDDPRAMTDAVDAAMVLTVDWSSHRELAVPFLEAGVPTLIDKPFAGSVTDVDLIEEAAKRQGTALYGGSAVPFHPAISSLRETNPDTLFCSGYGDAFYYGVHLIDTVRAVIDADWSRIEPLDSDGQVAAVHFVDGSTVTIDFDGSETDGTFAFLSVGDTTDTVKIESTPTELERMYVPYVERFIAAARGERDDRPRLVDGARLLLGVQAALENEQSVPPESVEMNLTPTTVDSSLFLANYEPYY